MSGMRHPDDELDRELRSFFERAERPAAPRSLDALLDGLPARRRRRGLAGFGAFRAPSGGSILKAFGTLTAGVAVVAMLAVVFGASFRFGASSAATAAASMAAVSPAGPTPTTAATSLPSAAATGAATAVASQAPATKMPYPSASALASASTAPGFISPDQALAAARAFLGDPNAALIVDSSGLSGTDPTYLVVNDSLAITVAAETGRIRSYSSPLKAPNGQPPTITLAQARSAADAFLAAHAIDTGGLVASQSFIPAMHAFRVEWNAAGNPASAPATVAVSVNPVTAEVFAFRDNR